MGGQQRILVIKLSALGDFVQAMGPFAAIRAHHPAARITLLTTKPFAALAGQSPYFDEVWTDSRPRPWEVAGLIRLRKMLRSVKFDMVYDLQTSDRSSSYFHIMGDPPWSGIANSCSHPHANPDRDLMHTIERQAEQLVMAGIPSTPPADLSWATADVARFNLPERYALIVPGGAPHRPFKRWPADRFAAVANHLALQGVVPLVLGTRDDDDQIKVVTTDCPTARSLSGQTSFTDVIVLARRAVGAVGNDTGPMHLIAAAGCPAVVLFSADSDPALCAPRGRVAVLRKDDLSTLAVDEVLAALAAGPAALREPAAV
ncbi:glycosyltransferase family 9 protein [Telmatospirillum sp.]|uniref:glycosyltransferase family 9 protein n=1 Tax=Telmatospirillum sp. TaxID=2079197 RepID=UPI002840EC3E|nr:glycosyltransferase family 9 protein [Telmatospirillum sp.]MDR3436976.1 glycosyltransferase family 9 protein [Telmatospirillum sp.]